MVCASRGKLRGACQAAARLFQRRSNIKPIKGLYYIEIPSSTDWAFHSNTLPFLPNTYIEVGEEAVDKKIESLQAYKGVMRDFPHPRSVEILKGLAAYRGGQSGKNYAEAFQAAFQILE